MEKLNICSNGHAEICFGGYGFCPLCANERKMEEMQDRIDSLESKDEAARSEADELRENLKVVVKRLAEFTEKKK